MRLPAPLRAVARHLAAAPEQPEPLSSPSTLSRQGGPTELPLARQDGHGQLTPDSVQELGQAMAEAAARLDFRTAAALKTMLDVLGPKHEPPPLSAFTSDDADEAADIFLEHGFCILPKQLSAGDLQRMRDAYEAAAPSAREAEETRWRRDEERKDLGKNFSFPMVDQEGGDPAYYALMDPPLLLEVMHRVLGRPARVGGSGGRVVPIADAELHAEAGYISWHRCIPPPHRNRLAATLPSAPTVFAAEPAAVRYPP